MKEEKLCVFCKHFEWEGVYSYSEQTQGGGYFECYKNHFEPAYPEYIEDFREIILQAKDCIDYERAASSASTV